MKFSKTLIFTYILFFVFYSHTAHAQKNHITFENLIKQSNWLGIYTNEHFETVAEYNYKKHPHFQTVALPYLKARGLKTEREINLAVRLDLLNLAHALTVLFEGDHEKIISSTMPEEIYSYFTGSENQIDHIGRELYGPITFYLDVLRELAPSLMLEHVKLPAGKNITPNGDIIFPSVQVVEALRKTDPDLKGVTIGRIYFHDQNGMKGCLELFQASLIDNSSPQDYIFTLARHGVLHQNVHLLYVTDFGDFLASPIEHFSIAVNHKDTVYKVHHHIKNSSNENMRLYTRQIAYNPADKSTNTKIAIKSDPKYLVFTKIIEIVHYGD